MGAARPSTSTGEHLRVEDAQLRAAPDPVPPIYFGGSSPAAGEVAARHADVYLTWGEPPAQVAEKIDWIRELADGAGPRARASASACTSITRDTSEEAWAEADRLLDGIDPDADRRGPGGPARSESEGQRRMLELHGGSTRRPRDLTRTCGPASAWSAAAPAPRWSAATTEVADRIEEYHALGIDEFILSGYPHLEEAYWFGEGVLPVLRRRGLLAEPRERRPGVIRIGRISASERNTSPDQTKFAYWVPNVSGGLVISNIEQRTDWGYDYNSKLARARREQRLRLRADARSATSPRYGAAYQHESTSFSLALLLATERLKVIAAVHPGLWHPGVLAKFIATADHLSDGRAADQRGVAAGSRTRSPSWASRGSSTASATAASRGVHPRTCARSGPRTHAEFRGDFYRLHDFDLKPKPLDAAAGAHTRRSSRAATPPPRGAWPAGCRDWYFANGKDFDGIAEQIADVDDAAADAADRTVKFGVNGFMIARDTEAEARDDAARDHRQGQPRGRRGLRRGGQAGRPVDRRTRRACGRTRTFADLVQYNDGFRTGLIGTPEQVADRMSSTSARRRPLPRSASCTSTRRSSTSASRSCRSCASSRRRRTWSGRLRRCDAAPDPLQRLRHELRRPPVARACGGTPRTRSWRYKDLDYWTDLAQLLERGRFDGMFIADVLGTYDVYGGSRRGGVRAGGAQVPVNDPLLLVLGDGRGDRAPRLRHHRRRPRFEHPYPFARRMSTLDHLTKGRVGWNIVTGYLAERRAQHRA